MFKHFWGTSFAFQYFIGPFTKQQSNFELCSLECIFPPIVMPSFSKLCFPASNFNSKLLGAATCLHTIYFLKCHADAMLNHHHHHHHHHLFYYYYDLFYDQEKKIIKLFLNHFSKFMSSKVVCLKVCKTTITIQ